MTSVLDTSAILAWLHEESGGDVVEPLLAESVMSAVNWSELAAKLTQREVPVERTLDRIRGLGVVVAPFTSSEAVAAGKLLLKTRGAGLSLGDRACLTLTEDTPEGVAITADRAWADLDLGIPLQLIR